MTDSLENLEWQANQTVCTVRGHVPLHDLGEHILTHEHLTSDFFSFHKDCNVKAHPLFDLNYLSLLNRGFLKMYPYSDKKNLILSNENIMKGELDLCIKAGIQTIVENSSYGLRKDINNLKLLSLKSGINIIAGTGFSFEKTQTTCDLSKKKEEMYNIMRMDLTEGYAGIGIKAGFIGEVGASSAITDFEKRSISATGEVQAQLKCPVSFTPASLSDPEEILRIYEEAGGNRGKAVITHVDRISKLKNKKNLMAFIDDAKCYVQFSMFGENCFFDHEEPSIDVLSDTQRIKRIELLVEEDEIHRVLISHDIHTKNRLTYYGGHGYTHIVSNIQPIIIKNRFCSKYDFRQIMSFNPKAWLSWN